MNVGQSQRRCLSSLCLLLGYSRQAYYRHLRVRGKEALEQELLLQETVRIRQDQKRLGSRKLLHMMNGFMLQHGINMGRDAFFDLLRQHGLLVRKRKRRKPQTTFSQHWLRKYPNLVADVIVTAPNELWVSDITYIHVKDGFNYLSLITDAYSRKIVGFYLSRDLAAKGCIYALKQAFKANPDHSDLIHHSDRGLQYCSGDYVKVLQKNNTKISMTQSGDPLENALAERVNGILKDELLQSCFESVEQAQQAVGVAISIYNHQRPHSSIDMLTPAVAHTLSGPLKKHWKNYYAIQKQKEVTMI